MKLIKKTIGDKINPIKSKPINISYLFLKYRSVMENIDISNYLTAPKRCAMIINYLYVSATRIMKS